MCDTVEEYLQEIKVQNTYIEKRIEDLHRSMSLRERVTTTYEMVPVSSSGNNDKLCDSTNKIFQIQKELDEKMDRFDDLKRDIKNLIEQLRDLRMFAVLDKMYFEYKPFDVIAREMGVCEKTVRSIHTDALQALDALWKENKKERVCDG